MNALTIQSRKVLLFLAICLIPFATMAKGQSVTAAHGLIVTEYPRTEKQTSESAANIPLDEFGDPIGELSVTPSLSPWYYAGNRNVIARGYLQIDADGDYAFTTDSFYDRNLLMIDGKLVCEFADGGDTIATIHLKKGMVGILSAGFIGGRGEGQGIDVRWRPPGQRELSPIPKNLLWNYYPQLPNGKNSQERPVIAKHLAVVTKDFVIDVYHNGERVSDDYRELLLDQFGASAEKVNIKVREGDWLVFHVAANRLRHQGSKYFAVAGMLDTNEFGFVSDHHSKSWTVCDDPTDAAQFIANRISGLERPGCPIDRIWEEGAGFMRQFAGPNFEGGPLWGEAPSTWIKFNSGDSAPLPIVASDPPELKPEPAKNVEPKPEPPVQAKLALLETPRWPVQILSAIYGTGGKDADVTKRVKQLIEVERKFFAANPGHLGADPNPHWNKGLHIVYMKDGVRRERCYNENGHVLPESFYGPQDKAELRSWIIGTRWTGLTGEIQFQKNGAITGPGAKAGAKWESIGDRSVRFTWSKKEKAEYQFDYLWSRFGDPKYPKADYRIVR